MHLPLCQYHLSPLPCSLGVRMRCLLLASPDPLSLLPPSSGIWAGAGWEASEVRISMPWAHSLATSPPCLRFWLQLPALAPAGQLRPVLGTCTNSLAPLPLPLYTVPGFNCPQLNHLLPLGPNHWHTAPLLFTLSLVKVPRAF